MTTPAATTPAAPTPRVLAVVPARGGSKGVPGKNLRRIGGVTLVARAVASLHRSGAVDTVVVSSDDDAVLAEAERAGASVVRRPAALAGDTASSESAVLHALDAEAAAGREYDLVVLVQATSPFLRARDLAGAVGAAATGATDAVVAAVPDHGFRWTQAPAGDWSPVGHDAAHRPRRQDLPPTVLETGAFYVTRVDALRATGSRFGRSARPWPVDPAFSLEIDTEADLVAAGRLDPWWDERPVDTAGVRLVVTDFDGVLTDDTAVVDQDGREAVRVSRADGLAADLFRARGTDVVVLSRETNPVVAARARKMRVEVVDSAQDKRAALAALLAERGLGPRDVVFVGNDVTDVVVRPLVRLFATPDDGHPAARAAADIVVDRPGGAGVLRRLYDLLVPASGAVDEDGDPPA